MSSLTEYVKTLPRIVIDGDTFKEVVIEIKINGVTVGENIVSLDKLNYAPSNGECNYTLSLRATK